jgi:hypothetical protein
MTIEAPQSFVVRQECEKAAAQNGFRRVLGEEAGWLAIASTTAQGTVHLASSGPHGPWFLALDHAGVIEELNAPQNEMAGPGRARYAFTGLNSLYGVLRRVYQLGMSLPDLPLREFEAQVRDLPRSTEIERLAVQRVGQNIFRDRLLDYWQGRCPLTGITDPGLLRASHIKPWARCESDAERLNVHNGLLLSALWDAAFDRGLVTFENDGSPRFSPNLSPTAKDALQWTSAIPLTAQHHRQLEWHRREQFMKQASSTSPALQR